MRASFSETSKKSNVLKDLFGIMKTKKSSEQMLKEARADFEGFANVEFKKK